MIMHYGSDYTLGHAYFNKMEHQELKLESCPSFLFADPKMEIEHMDKKDAMVRVQIVPTHACART